MLYEVSAEHNWLKSTSGTRNILIESNCRASSGVFLLREWLAFTSHDEAESETRR
jgi:hypothetical protein